jgi:hypothetical protein
MDVRMMGKRLPAGVQDGDEAEPGFQTLGGKRRERLSSRTHRQAIDERFVLESDLGRRQRQGAHDVKIGNPQQLGFAIYQPLRPRRALTLRAMAAAAGIVGDAR